MLASLQYLFHSAALLGARSDLSRIVVVTGVLTFQHQCHLDSL